MQIVKLTVTVIDVVVVIVVDIIVDIDIFVVVDIVVDPLECVSSSLSTPGHDRLPHPPWTRRTSGFVIVIVIHVCFAFIVVVVVVEDIVVDSPPKSFHPI